MLDLPNQESQPTGLNASLQKTSVKTVETPSQSVVTVGSTAKAAIEEGEARPPLAQRPQAYSNTLKVGSGDTLMKILLKAGINRGDAYTAIEALRKNYDPRRLRVGQTLDVTFQPGRHKEMPHTFVEMSLKTGFNKHVLVKRNSDGEYNSFEQEQELVTALHRANGVIDSSLYMAASDAGLPASLMMDFIFAYSFDVDFQRDIQKGDAFEIMYEKVSTADGKNSKIGNILYAALKLSGVHLPIYRYKQTDGRIAYFDDKGQSAQKALMRTPINGARLTSGFGKRRHPILGYSKMHTGIDFAAPSGTPIFAAGDGVIDFAGRKGGYGKYIRIRHNSEYKTAYAHMRAFKKGMYKGARVQQGDVIGYVGTTGRSTGPHLHYEIIRKGKKVNPMRVRMPSGRKLKGKELQAFLTVKERSDQQYADLAPIVSIASAE